MATHEREVSELLLNVERAINQFVNGDAEAYKACWLRDPEVSIFGGRGNHEVGWEQVSARLDWAASGFTNGWTEQEVLVSSFSADLGYTVSLEKGGQTVAGRTTESESILRVTHIFRRVQDSWRIVHRHADPVIAKTSTEAILIAGDT